MTNHESLITNRESPDTPSMTRLVVLTAAVLCVAGHVNAQGSPENFNLEAGVMLWKPSPDIVITSGTLGTPVDFVNTFPIEEKRIREFRLVLKGGKHKVRFNTEEIKYDATATLTQAVQFRGQTYVVGVPTTATLDWTLRRIGYEFDPIATTRGFVGVFGDLEYNKMNAQLSAPGIETQTFERNVTVPTIGGTARAYLTQYVSVTAELTALKLTHSDSVAKFSDFDLYGTVNFGRNVGAQYGYRSVTVNYDIETDTGDLKLKGRYLGVVVRF
jgi:hypothetical protein